MKILRFIFTGLVTTSISYFVFLVIYLNADSVLLSLVSANVIGIFLSFMFNRFWVWRIGNRKSIYKFISIQSISVVINWLILHFISLTDFPRQIAQIFISILFAFLFFIINNKYIFKN
jgi:putative flippase GtrA